MARAEPELRPCGITAGYMVASGHTKPSEFAPDPPNQRTVLGISLYEVSLQVEDVDAVTIQSALLEVKDKSIHMLHKMVHDAPAGKLRLRPWWSRFISTQQSAGQFDSPKTYVRG